MFELGSVREATRGLGNLWSARSDPLRFFLDVVARGPVTPMHMGIQQLYVVGDATLAEAILMQPEVFTKDTRGQQLLRAVIGVGLVTAEGEVWRTRRRIAQPAFRRPALEVYARQMGELAEELADALLLREGTVDIGAEMMGLALKIASRSLFGDRLDDDGPQVEQALDVVLRAFLKMIGQPLQHPERVPIGPAARYRRAVKVLDGVVARLIARRRAAGSDGEDLLHLWLASGLDDGAIRDEVLTMLLAAHETTANAMTWAWTLLARDPASRRALQAEVDGVDVVAASLSRGGLPWTEAVVKETLRLYPTIWTNARRVTEDTVVNGHAFPKGALAFLCTYAFQHDPELWPDPEGFDPARWTEGRATGPWMPFGAGPRKCIGSHFAMFEAQIVIATLARRVDLELLPGQSLAPLPSLTLRPLEPVRVRVRPRHSVQVPEATRSVISAADSATVQ